MYQLGWSQPGYFESKEDEIALHHCIARYHAYVGNGEEMAFHSVDTPSKVPRSHSLRASLFLRTHPGHRYSMAVRESTLSYVQTDAFCSTHQLLPQKYGDNCRKYIERFVNQLVVSLSGPWLLDSNVVRFFKR